MQLKFFIKNFDQYDFLLPPTNRVLSGLCSKPRLSITFLGNSLRISSPSFNTSKMMKYHSNLHNNTVSKLKTTRNSDERWLFPPHVCWNSQLLGFSWWLIQRKTWCTIYPGHLVRLRDESGHVPVYTSITHWILGYLSLLRGCSQSEQLQMSGVVITGTTVQWQQWLLTTVTDNTENLTIHNTLQPQSERELALFHNTATMSQFSPHKNNESVWLPNDSRITINTQTIYGPLYSSTQTLTTNSLQ